MDLSNIYRSRSELNRNNEIQASTQTGTGRVTVKKDSQDPTDLALKELFFSTRKA